MPDRVDYRFRNGWVDTGDLPSREALRAMLPSRAVSCPDGPFGDVHPGGDGDEVDFSCFRHRPTLIARGLACRLRAATAGRARFRLTTCGGVRLWLDGAPVGVFEPFERNRHRSTEIEFGIGPGEHGLTVRLEDLHERDTVCAFSLVLLDGPPLATALAGDHDPGRVDAVAALLAGMRTGAVFSEGEPIRLVAGDPPEAPVRLTVAGLVPFLRGGITNDPDIRREIEATLGPDASSAEIAAAGAAPAGCLEIEVSAMAGSARLSRRLGMTCLPPGTPLRGTYGERLRQAGDLIAAAAGFDPSVAALLAMRGA